MDVKRFGLTSGSSLSQLSLSKDSTSRAREGSSKLCYLDGSTSSHPFFLALSNKDARAETQGSTTRAETQGSTTGGLRREHARSQDRAPTPLRQYVTPSRPIRGRRRMMDHMYRHSSEPAHHRQVVQESGRSQVVRRPGPGPGESALGVCCGDGGRRHVVRPGVIKMQQLRDSMDGWESARSMYVSIAKIWGTKGKERHLHASAAHHGPADEVADGGGDDVARKDVGERGLHTCRGRANVVRAAR